MIPQGSRYHVRFLKGAEKTRGGIYLPESLRTNYQEAEVLAVGPGRDLGEHGRSTMWCEVGDIVFFPQHHFRPFKEGADEGCVADEHLVGVVHPNLTVEPLNDWVLLDLPPFEAEAASALVLPEELQRRPCKGAILDHGPGAPRARGPLCGLLKPVHEILNLPAQEVVGQTAHWEDGAEVYEFGREWTEGVLVQAGSLIAVES